MRLSGRVAVITGSRTGIGKGLARAFLAEGAQVVINGRDPSGHSLAKELDRNGNCVYVVADIRIREEVDRLVSESIANFGRVDIAVNNAGGSDAFAMIHEMTDEAWENALSWNIRASFWLTRSVLPGMMSRQWGRIINMSSVEGKQANKANIAHYITNKHGLAGLTKATAFEYGAMGITCNAICPGAIETEQMLVSGPAYAEAAGSTYDEFKRQYAEASAIKRFNTVEEVASLAVLLASDDGGGINGAQINVDGFTAQY